MYSFDIHEFLHSISFCKKTGHIDVKIKTGFSEYLNVLLTGSYMLKQAKKPD